MIPLRPFLLASLLLLPVASTATAQQRPALPRPLTRWEQTARDLLEELIEINTTESSGSTLKAAEAMAARLRGRNRTLKPILLLSRIDVVEEKPEDWTLPPFTFIEKDGTFFGRGVADDKDDAAIHLMILERMKAEGVVPDRDIVVALTTDEEGGPENGVGFLLERCPDLMRAEFAFNE